MKSGMFWLCAGLSLLLDHGVPVKKLQQTTLFILHSFLGEAVTYKMKKKFFFHLKKYPATPKRENYFIDFEG